MGGIDVQQVGGRIAIDAQRAHPYLETLRHHAGGLPCQLPGGIAQAPLADLGVAGGDEIELAGQAVTVLMLLPVRVEHGFERPVKIQRFYEPLESFSRYLNVGRGIVTGRGRSLEQAVVHFEGCA